MARRGPKDEVHVRCAARRDAAASHGLEGPSNADLARCPSAGWVPVNADRFARRRRRVESRAVNGPDGLSAFSDARKRLIDAPAWRDYVEKVYSIDPGGYPFLTYVGIDFAAVGITRVRLCFSFFRRLSPREIDVVLPVSDRRRFEGYYARWQPTTTYDPLHRGATFQAAIESDGSLTYGYHLRLPGRPAGEPSRQILTMADRNQHHGLTEVFSPSARRLDKHFYCQDRDTLRQSIDAAGLTDLAREMARISWLQYTESDIGDRWAWVTDSRPLIAALADRGPSRFALALEMFCRRLGFLPFGPGTAKSGDEHSLHFALAHVPGAEPVFDGVRRFMTHFLRIR